MFNWPKPALCFISIHTPTKGVTKDAPAFDAVWNISIHTPAKGVTPPYFKDLIFSMYFNPHSRKGSDVIDDSTGDIISQFQSTLPQREWLSQRRTNHMIQRFQSTLPQREWLCSKFQKLILDLFQSTLPQREWPQAYFKTYNDAYVSIHTPAKGVTTRRHLVLCQDLVQVKMRNFFPF